jgi:mono/diheme cytochrome c family protein
VNVDHPSRPIANVIGLFFSASLVFVGCGGGGGSHTASTSTHSTATSLPRLQEGAQLFQAKCASCHDVKLAAQVTRDFPNIDDETAVVTNGRANPLETMPSFESVLTPEQIREVVEYTRVQLGR